MAAQNSSNAKQLDDTLAELLVSGSLYKKLSYDGSEANYTNTTSRSKSERYGHLPLLLRMYCSDKQCQLETLWATERSDKYFGVDRFHEAQYTCRELSKKSHHILAALDRGR